MFPSKKAPFLIKSDKKKLITDKENKRIIVKDISGGKESHPIPLINNRNNEVPKSFAYTTLNNRSAETRRLIDDQRVPKGCDCADGICGSNCACERNSIVSFDPKHRIVVDPFGYNFYTDFYVQCGPHCGCVGDCKRQMLPHGKVLKKLEVHWMKGKGFGVLAAQPIAAGMPIAEYVGEVFVATSDEESFRPSHYQQDLFTDNFSNKYIIDARRIGNVSRFINHSCFNNILQICVYPSIPNLRRTSPLPKVALVAFRDILPGQELCFDYRAAYFNSRHMPCLCYQPNCHAPPYNHLAKSKSIEEVKNEVKANKRKMFDLFEETGDLEPLEDFED